MSRARAALLLAAAAICGVGCGGEKGSASRSGSGGGATAAGGGSSGTDTSRAAMSAESLAVARNLWNKPEVVRRLEEAGLVVADSGKRVTQTSLHVGGEQLLVSGGHLDLYMYPDDAAREKDGAGLDTTRKGLPSIYDPKYIISGNLIAILHTPKDRLAERVRLVLMSRHGGGS
jgi:hypothetical protein